MLDQCSQDGSFDGGDQVQINPPNKAGEPDLTLQYGSIIAQLRPAGGITAHRSRPRTARSTTPAGTLRRVTGLVFELIRVFLQAIERVGSQQKGHTARHRRAACEPRT